MIYWQLFYEFFKVGLFSIGGGMATFPFLSALADKTGWFTQAQLADMIAISESTPGPIGVNMATGVGYTTGGILGSVCATVGLITPSVIVILIIARFLKSFRENKHVNNVFYGLRPASTGLIAAAGLSVVILSLFNIDLYRASGRLIDVFNFKAIILAAVIYILSNHIKPTKKLHPIVFILFSAAVGILFQFAGVS